MWRNSFFFATRQSWAIPGEHSFSLGVAEPERNSKPEPGTKTISIGVVIYFSLFYTSHGQELRASEVRGKEHCPWCVSSSLVSPFFFRGPMGSPVFRSLDLYFTQYISHKINEVIPWKGERKAPFGLHPKQRNRERY